LTNCEVALCDPKAAGRLLPWTYRIISNAKAVFRGTDRIVSENYLPAYLSEICYRFNRRFWEKELFDRLVNASKSTETVTYHHVPNPLNLGYRAPVQGTGFGS
jgi:hypothetical protein